MYSESDERNTDTSGDIQPVLVFLTLYRHSIGRVRPEAVSLAQPAWPLGIVMSRLYVKK